MSPQARTIIAFFILYSILAASGIIATYVSAERGTGRKHSAKTYATLVAFPFAMTLIMIPLSSTF